MPRKSNKLEVPVKMVPTGRWLVVIDYLDVNNMERVETFAVPDKSAGYARQKKIMQDGLLLIENNMDCLYPPHRILKISVGEEKIGSKG